MVTRKDCFLASLPAPPRPYQWHHWALYAEWFEEAEEHAQEEDPHDDAETDHEAGEEVEHFLYVSINKWRLRY
jgi:hypothetical protein